MLSSEEGRKVLGKEASNVIDFSLEAGARGGFFSFIVCHEFVMNRSQARHPHPIFINEIFSCLAFFGFIMRIPSFINGGNERAHSAGGQL